jgi:hypothetical protein
MSMILLLCFLAVAMKCILGQLQDLQKVSCFDFISCTAVYSDLKIKISTFDNLSK